jgi:triphosphatase
MWIDDHSPDDAWHTTARALELQSMENEIELKFSIQPEFLRKLASMVPWLGEAQAQNSEQLITAYFDTPQHYLKHHGIFLRVRQSGDRFKQSIKQTNGIQRKEWEHEITKRHPEQKFVEDKALRSMLGKRKVSRSLEAIFETRVQRSSYIWRAGSTRIQIAIDEGGIEARDRRLQIHEVELELKTGDPWELFKLGRALVQNIPATLSFTSKGERGYLLSDGQWGIAKKATTPRLREHMSAQEALRTICYSCMNTFMLNYSMFETATADVDLVHQMRVSIRRLRAAMTFFEPISRKEESRSLRKELKWISDLLGSARDFDVWQTKALRPKLSDDRPIKGIAALIDHVEAHRLNSHIRLKQGLKSDRLRVLLLDLSIWLTREESAVGMHEVRKTSVGKYLDRYLRRQLDKFLKVGKHLEMMDAAEQHRLRIRAKKLRYVVEFFEDFARNRKAFDVIVGTLETLQSALGEIHDTNALSAYLTAEFGKRGSSRACDAAFAAGMVVSNEPGQRTFVERARRSRRELSDWRPFWSR